MLRWPLAALHVWLQQSKLLYFTDSNATVTNRFLFAELNFEQIEIIRTCRNS